MLSSLSLLPSLVFLLHSCHVPTYPPNPPNPQIKRFLEDSDDTELNKFVKDYPGGKTCHQPEARPQILEPKPQALDLC